MALQIFDEERLIIIQTIAGTRVDHGGTSRSVPNLAENLAALGKPVWLVAGRPPDDSIRSIVCKEPVQTRWVTESRVHRQFQIRSRFRRKLAEILDSATCDQTSCHEGSVHIIHDHGIWLGNNRAVADVCRRRRLIRVVSPRGMVSPWSLAHGGLKKQVAWAAFQRRDLSAATAFHATGEQEAEDLRRLGLQQPIAVIPNGIELPQEMPPRRTNPARRTCLFLSRIHPKKGLPNLLHAWKKSMSKQQCWRLLLVGPDENQHRGELASLVQSLDLQSEVEFMDAASDSRKWELYRQADLFVLPSFSENFGIVIAEALAAGVPVITTTATPWQSLDNEKLGWWVEPEIDAIATALSDAAQLPNEGLVSMGKAGALWAVERFAWDGIAERMLAFYRWLADPKSDQPSFVV